MSERKYIQHYHSTTPGNVPSAEDLLVGEIAINAADEKIFFKNVDDEVIALGVGGADYVPLTYAELVELRNNGKLIPGCTYLIINYKPVISNDASGEGFETYPTSEYLYAIAVVANSNHALSKQAKMLNQAGESYSIEYELDVNTVDHWWLKDSYPSHINGTPHSGVFLDRITTVDGKVLYLKTSSVQIQDLTYDIYVSSDNDFYALITETALETGVLMFKTNGSEITTSEYITIAFVEKVIIVNTGYTASGGLTQVLAVRANAIVGSKADRLMWNDSTHEVSSVVVNIEDITGVEHTDPNYSTGAVVWMRDKNHNEARFDFKSIIKNDAILFENSKNCKITGPLTSNWNFIKDSTDVNIMFGENNIVINSAEVVVNNCSSVNLNAACKVELINCDGITWELSTGNENVQLGNKFFWFSTIINCTSIRLIDKIMFVSLNNCMDCTLYGGINGGRLNYFTLNNCMYTTVDCDYSEEGSTINNDSGSTFREVSGFYSNNTLECDITGAWRTTVANCYKLTVNLSGGASYLSYRTFNNCYKFNVTGSAQRSCDFKNIYNGGDFNLQNVTFSPATISQDSNKEIQIYNEADLLNQDILNPTF